MSPFQKIVRAELASARSKFPDQHSAHEAYAVILEELDEFWDQCRLRTDQRSNIRMLQELCQIAAMSQRAAEDLKLIDPEKFELPQGV